MALNPKSFGGQFYKLVDRAVQGLRPRKLESKDYKEVMHGSRLSGVHVLLICCVVTGILSFCGISRDVEEVARILLVVFLVLIAFYVFSRIRENFRMKKKGRGL
jgi:uncharacterized membrane protein YtjA (UPF0391 family)